MNMGSDFYRVLRGEVESIGSRVSRLEVDKSRVHGNGERVIMDQEERNKAFWDNLQEQIDKAKEEGNTDELTRLFIQAQLAQMEENPDEDEDEDLNDSEQYDEV